MDLYYNVVGSIAPGLEAVGDRIELSLGDRRSSFTFVMTPARWHRLRKDLLALPETPDVPL